MAFSQFSHVSLAAISAVVPAGKVSLENELCYYDNNLEKAQRLSAISGLSTRRIAPEGVTASDMCIQAAQNLLTETGINKEEIGALIFVSHSPDYLLPASAAIQQHELGLSAHCATMDMNVGCAGFMKGFWVASGLVESGACKKVLLLVGDTPNRFLNPENRITSPVFGDAGTAALIEYNDHAEPISFLLGSNGAKYEALVIPGGGSRIPQQATDTPNDAFTAKVADPKGNPWTLGGYGQIWMDGMAIYSFGVSVIPPHITRHLSLIGLTIEDINTLLLHQANKVIIESIAKKTGIDIQKVPSGALQKYGNLGSSSIPNLMCDYFATTPEKNKQNTMLCGFGAGLSWASCVLSLQHTQILPVQDYVPPAHIPTREERIAYWHNKFAGN